MGANLMSTAYAKCWLMAAIPAHDVD
jgi:hypothetical protein